MALNRFYAPGQSQYISQYVPHKLPFELWQQQIQQKDAKVQSDIDAIKSQYNQDITGTDSAELGQYYKNIYGDSPELSRILQSVGEIQIGDRMRSQQSAQNINSKADALLADDYVMKSLTGDLADGIIKLNKEVKQHKAYNAKYDERTKALDGIYKSIANKKDWELDPSLLFQQEKELNKMDDVTYVPKETGVGDYFDASKYILDEVNRMKDSGGKSYDYSDPLYVKWNSSHGVSADKYADFAEDIWNNQASPVRADAERRVSALIDKGLYTEADRAALLEYEKNKLKDTARNLQHKTSDTGERFKSGEERDAINQGMIFPEDAPNATIYDGVSTTFNTVAGNNEKLGTYLEEANKYISTKFGYSPEEFAVLDRNALSELSYKLGIPTADLLDQQQQYNALKGKKEEADLIYNINKSNLEEVTGYNDSTRGTENLFNFIKQNPAQAQQYLEAIKDPNNTLYKELRNTPMYEELQTMVKYNPDLYNELEKGVLEGNTLGLYTSQDFIVNGEFDEKAARSFLSQYNITPIVKAGGGNNLTQEEFNRLIRENSNQYKLNSTVQEINTSKTLYEKGANMPFELTDAHVSTTPGLYMNIDKEYLDEMSRFSNPHASTLNLGSTVLGADVDASHVKNALIKTYLSQNKDMGMTMISPDTYKIEGTALNSIFQDTESYQLFLNEYSMSKSGTPRTDLSPDELKELNAEVTAIGKGSSTFELTLKVDKSTEFTNFLSNKVTSYNSNLDWSDPNNLDYNLKMVSTSNIINNEDAIKQAHELSNNSAIINTGVSTSGSLPRTQQIPFTLDYYNGESIQNTQWRIVNIQQSVDQSTSGESTTIRTNPNGSTSTYNNSGIIQGTSGQYYDGSKIYTYTIQDPSGNIHQIPAHSFEEALQNLSDSVTGVYINN